MEDLQMPGKKRIIKVIFPLLLLIWPVINAAIGFSLTDTSYSLTNYMFFKESAGSWKYATFLSNYAGYIIYNICDGKLLFINIITGLFISITALTVYNSMKNEISPSLLFLSLLTAEGLCWCPSVILYNYLSYLSLTLAAVLIYKAVVNNNKVLFFMAGIILGISFFIRISNAIYVTLIISVIAGLWLYKAEGKKVKWVKPILCCILGYLSGMAIVVLLMVFTTGIGGMESSLEWAISLFTSNEESGGYSFSEMIKTIFDNYFVVGKWFLVMVTGIVAGMCVFLTFKDKFLWVKRIGYVLCTGLMFYWFLRNGVFNINYRNTGAIFGLSVIFILWQFVLLFYVVINTKTLRSEKLLAFIAIIILVITPLGTNNHLFATINNMFFVMPVCAGLGLNFYKKYKDEVVFFPLWTMITALAVILFVQSALFHNDYIFKCGENGEERNVIISEKSNLDYIHMDQETAEIVSEAIAIKAMILKSDSSKDSLILYGDIPGIAYVLNMKPGISTTWPDLDSYSEYELSQDISSAKGNNIVIIKNGVLDDDDTKKELILKSAEGLKHCYHGIYLTAFY